MPGFLARGRLEREPDEHVRLVVRARPPDPLRDLRHSAADRAGAVADRTVLGAELARDLAVGTDRKAHAHVAHEVAGVLAIAARDLGLVGEQLCEHGPELA